MQVNRLLAIIVPCFVLVLILSGVVIKDLPNFSVEDLNQLVLTELVASPTPTPVVIPNQVLGAKSDSPSPTATQATVKRVVDGDTIELESGEKVRYIGMDTPETKSPTKGVQCYGHEASLRNQQLVEGKVVTLEKDVSNTDRYGRLLRYVSVDGVSINHQLVAEGYALASSYPPDIARQAEYRAAEAEARTKGLGLWSSCPAPSPARP